jgi:hypothetical protein
MKTVKNPITIDKVELNQFKDTMNSAQLRQVIEKTYQAASISNDKKDAFTDFEDFDLEEKTFQETRVTWVDVPLDWEVEKCEERLLSMEGACIYRELSSEPILTTNHYGYMDSLETEGERTEFLEGIKDSQQVVNGETGEIILHGGLPQYRAVFFSATEKEDVDTRAKVDVTTETYKGQSFQVNAVSQKEAEAIAEVEETIEQEPQF